MKKENICNKIMKLLTNKQVGVKSDYRTMCFQYAKSDEKRIGFFCNCSLGGYSWQQALVWTRAMC